MVVVLIHEPKFIYEPLNFVENVHANNFLLDKNKYIHNFGKECINFSAL
jgi:hypothetical protein